MPPSCLEAHATPSHENGDRAPSNPPLYPPPPADTRDSVALARGAELGVHARTPHERRKKGERTESAKENGENKDPLEKPGK